MSAQTGGGSVHLMGGNRPADPPGDGQGRSSTREKRGSSREPAWGPSRNRRCTKRRGNLETFWEEEKKGGIPEKSQSEETGRISLRGDHPTVRKGNSPTTKKLRQGGRREAFREKNVLRKILAKSGSIEDPISVEEHALS